MTDNASDKWGTTINGVTIYEPDSLPTKTKKLPVIVCSVFFEEVITQLKNLDFLQLLSSLPALNSPYFKKSNPVIPPYSLRSIELYKFSVAAVETKGSYVKSLDIVLTEKCSLRCRDCSNLMQYYQSPIHCNEELILTSFKNFLHAVDHVFEIRILGGEPFMFPHFDKVIKAIKKYKNISYITVYTNGTIVPSINKLNALVDKNIFVLISDYGKVSRKLSILRKTFEDFGIMHEVVSFEKWQDCGTIAKRKRSVNKLEQVYKECCANTIFTLLHGKLYRCPFAAHLTNLGLLEESRPSVVNLSPNNESLEALREKIDEFLITPNYIDACRFCGGRGFNDATIEPAIQETRPRALPPTNL